MDGLQDLSFDGWTLRRATGELEKDDTRIRLPLQSARVLEELLLHPGELVTREALIAKVWPRGVVEYETALNTIVHRLRVALGDHATLPKYIETVPRRGYRFIAHVGPPTIHEAAALANVAVPAAGSFPKWGSMSRAVAVAALVVSLTTGAILAARDAPQEPAGAAAPRSVDPSTREMVARARTLLQRRGPGDVERARRNFSAAVAADPGYADAWAGLSSAAWIGVPDGRSLQDQCRRRVMTAAMRALEIDPGLAEAHMRLAACHWQLGESNRAEAHLRLAKQHQPTHPLVLAAAVEDALAAGLLAEAISLQRRIVYEEPLAIAGRQNLIALLLMAGRLEESEVEIERMRELQPTAPDLAENKVELLVLRGRFDEALVLAQGLGNATGRHFYSSVALHALGRDEEADASLRALVESIGDSDPVRVAEAMAYRGLHEDAIDRLAAAKAQCSKAWLQHSPYLRSLRDDPRWEAWIES